MSLEIAQTFIGQARAWQGCCRAARTLSVPLAVSPGEGEELATCKVPCKLNITYLPCPSAVVEGRKNVLVINWW